MSISAARKALNHGDKRKNRSKTAKKRIAPDKRVKFDKNIPIPGTEPSLPPKVDAELLPDPQIPGVIESESSKSVPKPKRTVKKVVTDPNRPPYADNPAYQRLLILKKKKLAALIFLQKYQRENRLEYFNGPNALVTGKFLRANPKQQLILDAWDNRQYMSFVYTGGNRGGKTTLGVIITLSTLFGEWLWNKKPLYFPHKEPRKARLVVQDWDGAIKILVPELLKWWPKIRPHKSKKNNMGVDAFWTDEKSGSTLEIMTGNQDPMLHEGGHHDLIWFDEPISRDHYIANARGLVDRQGRELFTMTLLEEAWIDREIVNKTLVDPITGRDTGRSDPSVFVVNMKSTDNIGYGISEAGLKAFAAKLTEEEREVRISGIPRYKKGLVYPKFDRKVHVKERFRIPLDWPVDIAIDTHPRKPHSVLLMATNPRGVKYCIAEIRMHGDGKALAEEIIRVVKWGVYRVNKVIIDPLSKGDSNEDETTFVRVFNALSRHGMFLETASKNKDAGVLAVKEYLMSENQEPSLFFFDDLVYTIREITGLMWEKEGLSDKEKISKVEDDMCENLYRLILLETEYIPPADEDTIAPEVGRENVNETTGY